MFIRYIIVVQLYSPFHTTFVNGSHQKLKLSTALTKLSLYKNQFTGSLSSQLGLLTNLQHLDFGSNSLNGPIPRLVCCFVDLMLCWAVCVWVWVWVWVCIISLYSLVTHLPHHTTPLKIKTESYISAPT